MRERTVVVGLFTIGVFLVVITALLFYKERAPQDNSAATIYYLSPNGCLLYTSRIGSTTT